MTNAVHPGRIRSRLAGPTRVLAGSPARVTLLVVAVWALLVLLVVGMRYGYDPRALLIVGSRTQLPPAFASIPTTGPTGYDGQMYAALATDPFLRHLDTAHYLDAPSYRATRILVPLLAWLLALGHASAAIVWYQLICWGLAVGAVWLLARWLSQDGRSTWWAAAAAGSAGVAAVILRSTPDGASIFFILAALYLHDRERKVQSLALAAVAVLARETSVLAALAIAAVELRRGRRASALGFAAVPAAVGLGWQLYLAHTLGRAFDTGVRNFGLPFLWLPHKLTVVFHAHNVWWLELLGTLAIIATAFAFVAVASNPVAWDAPALTFLAFAGMGFCLGDAVYSEAWAYGRALIAVPFCAALIAASETLSWRRRVVGSVAVLYFVVGVGMARAELRDALLLRGHLGSALKGATPGSVPAGFSAAPSARAAGPAENTVWVLPVANARGRAGSVWQTRVEIENPGAAAVRVSIELHSTSTDCGDAARRTVALEPQQRLEWSNVVGDLFGRAGIGGLRVTSEVARVTVHAVTWNAALRAAPDRLQPAIPEEHALHGRQPVFFEGLAHDPDRAAGVRTNLGLLNLADTPITFRVEGFDVRRQPLGRFEGRLDPCRFAQIDDLLARFRAPKLEGASARVTALTPVASFLAYASVTRGPGAPAVHLYPEPRPAP